LNEVLLVGKATGNELQNFIRGMGALRLLLRKASQSGSLIECIVIYAGLVDGLLRIGLVLKRQIVNKNSDIDEILIVQKPGSKFLVERAVYKLALEEGVIDQRLFETISGLYDRRNEVVHRFILTNLSYNQLAPTLENYENVFNHLYRIIYDLEALQIQLGLGMSAIDTSARGSKDRQLLQEVILKIAPEALKQNSIEAAIKQTLQRSSKPAKPFEYGDVGHG
jgi:hypothetical protein